MSQEIYKSRESRNLIIKYIQRWIFNKPYLLRLRLMITKNEKI